MRVLHEVYNTPTIALYHQIFLNHTVFLCSYFYCYCKNRDLYYKPISLFIDCIMKNTEFYVIFYKFILFSKSLFVLLQHINNRHKR